MASKSKICLLFTCLLLVFFSYLLLFFIFGPISVQFQAESSFLGPILGTFRPNSPLYATFIGRKWKVSIVNHLLKFENSKS